MVISFFGAKRTHLLKHRMTFGQSRRTSGTLPAVWLAAPSGPVQKLAAMSPFELRCNQMAKCHSASTITGHFLT